MAQQRNQEWIQIKRSPKYNSSLCLPPSSSLPYAPSVGSRHFLNSLFASAQVKDTDPGKPKNLSFRPGSQPSDKCGPQTLLLQGSKLCPQQLLLSEEPGFFFHDIAKTNLYAMRRIQILLTHLSVLHPTISLVHKDHSEEWCARWLHVPC